MDAPNQDWNAEQERSALERRQMETPEDVAVLYSWANLHGAKYRDFSASRREYRAQMRHRAAEQQAEAELQAKRDAEAAALKAEEDARREEQVRRDSGERRAMEIAEIEQLKSESAQRQAYMAAEAARHAEQLSAAQAALQKAEQEVVAAREAAKREQELYAEREREARYKKTHQQDIEVRITDPYESPHRDHPILEHEMHEPDMEDYHPLPAHRQVDIHHPVVSTDRGAIGQIDTPPMHTHVVQEQPLAKPVYREAPPKVLPPQQKPVYAAPEKPVYREPQRVELQPEYPVFHPAAQAPPPGQAAYQPLNPEPSRQYFPSPTPQQPALQQAPPPPMPPVQRQQGFAGYRPDQPSQQMPAVRIPPPPPPPPRQEPMHSYEQYPQPARPAWLYTDHEPIETMQHMPVAPVAPPPQQMQQSPSPMTDTLQHSRERVASRWFALKGVFDSSQEQEQQPVRHKEPRTPALALFSLAGGVGKTSMVATLGRALASLGEKVLLTDTTSYGLLPFYFGARELRPGVVRTFSPPSGSTDAPIYLVNYEVSKPGDNPDWLADEIIRNSVGTNRVLLDLGTGSAQLTRRIAKLSPTILVPVAPDMNSVIGLANVEKYFNAQVDLEGRPIQPVYLLNQFDASLPLHLDVREVMREQLGDRLLPFVIRRSPAVSEALAEGMTVMDYAPGSPVAEDYMNLAGWLRSLSAPAAADLPWNSLEREINDDEYRLLARTRIR